MKKMTLLGVSMAVAAGPAFAADWSFDPKIAVSGEYNDNNRLTEIPGREIKVSGALLDAQVAMRAETPRSSFDLTPRLRSSFYPGDETEDADDQFVRMLARHSTERTTASLDVDYSRVITLGDYFPTSSVSDDDVLGDPDRGVGVGRIGLRNREDRLAFTPVVSFKLSPRRSLEFRADYLDVGYDIQIPGDRVDYSDLSGSIALRNSLSEISSLTVRAGYSSYDPSDGDSRVANVVDVAWSKDFSETAQTYVRVGATRVEVGSGVSGGSSSWETGFAGGVGVRWAFEVTEIWVDVSENLDPNSAGDLVTRDEARVQVARRIGPMTRVYLAGRLILDSSAGGTDSFVDRSYATGTLGFEWRFARQWTLVASYDYAWREYDNAITDAESNAASLGIVYQPNRR